MAAAKSVLEEVLRRDRLFVVSSLIAVVVLAWAYLLLGVGMSMHDMSMPMPGHHTMWTPGYTAVVLAMWAVMMAAMMLPSAAPMILLYGTIARRRQETGNAVAGAGVFGLGYLAVWAAFTLGAVALQFALDHAALLSPMMVVTSRVLSGLVLIAAGLYQWTALKQACLRRCRSPLEFIMTEWREGPSGAFAMGLRHGVFCLGCCWLLMLLLFVGGIMNMAWIAGIAAFVLVEKLAPAGHWIGRAAGVALVMWGGATVVAGLA
jgi:predicted metal-binding membrane protein